MNLNNIEAEGLRIITKDSFTITSIWQRKMRLHISIRYLEKWDLCSIEEFEAFVSTKDEMDDMVEEISNMYDGQFDVIYNNFLTGEDKPIHIGPCWDGI